MAQDAHQRLYRTRALANAVREGFIENTVRLDQRQLITQIETLEECKAEDESATGKLVTQRCIDFALAVGHFKFPSTFDRAVKEHFQG